MLKRKKKPKLGLGVEVKRRKDAPLPPTVEPKDVGLSKTDVIEEGDGDGIPDFTSDELKGEVSKEIKRENKKSLKEDKLRTEAQKDLPEVEIDSSDADSSEIGGSECKTCKHKRRNQGSMGGMIKNNLPILIGVGVIGIALGMILKRP